MKIFRYRDGDHWQVEVRVEPDKMNTWPQESSFVQPDFVELRAKAEDGDQMFPPARGWKVKNGSTWQFDSEVECTRKVSKALDIWEKENMRKKRLMERSKRIIARTKAVESLRPRQQNRPSSPTSSQPSEMPEQLVEDGISSALSLDM